MEDENMGKADKEALAKRIAQGEENERKENLKKMKKELKKKYVAPMKLDALEAYATSHGIPALTPTIRRAIEGLKKQK